MPQSLRSKFFWVVVIFLIAQAHSSLSQSCNGRDGIGPVGGGLSLVDNGQICANKGGSPAIMRIEANNVDDGGNPNLIAFEINWNDGTTQTVSVLAGEITNTGPGVFVALVPHLFPPAGANAQCIYDPTARLVVNGLPCNPLGGTPRYIRWNTEQENSGVLDLSETVSGVVEYLVCEGVSTTVTFTDRTTLNCVPPALTSTINQFQRWRQFEYGTGNTITGTVLIGGVAQPIPFADVINASATPPPAITTPGQIPGQVTQTITIPATALAGEFFEITMNYWNFCNQYDDSSIAGPPLDLAEGDNAPVPFVARILVVAQPPAPTATSNEICSGTSLPDFTIAHALPSSAVLWFQDNAGVPGAPIVNPNGTNSNSLPASAFAPGPIDNSVGGSYTVWASYQGVANAFSVTCTSPAVPVTLVIRNPLSNPPALPSQDVCNGSTETFTLAAPPGSQPFGGAVEYEWIATDGANNPVGDIVLVPQPDQVSVEATFNLGGGFVTRTRKIRVRRVFSSGIGCPSPFTDIPITVYGPSTPGMTSGGGTFCQGVDVGSVTWTPGRGNIVRWELSTDGGLTFADAGLGTSSTINPGILAAGNYIYRAVIQNGPCSSVIGDDVTFNISVNPTPSVAGTDQQLCNLLISNPFGASTAAPGVGTWTLVSKPAGAPDPTISDINSRNATVSIPSFLFAGVYTFRWTVVNGPCTSFDDVDIDFGGDPTNPAAGSDDTVCGENYTLAGNTPTVGSGVWTVVSGPGGCTTGCPISISDTADPSASLQLTGGPAFTYGSYTLRWTITSGTCLPESDDVIITFTESATAIAMADFTACFESAPTFPPIDLTGTVSITPNGRWEVVSGTGVIESSGAAVGNSIAAATINDRYVPTATDYTNGGSVTVRLVALDPDGPTGPCTSQSDDVMITIERRPSNVNAGADQPNVCTDSTDLAALAPMFGTGTWTSSNGSVVIDDPLDPQSRVRNLPVGVPVTFTWTVSSLGAECADVTDDVVVTRQPLPTVLNINPATVCEDVLGGPVETNNIDLTTYNDAVTTVPAANRLVTWFDISNNNLGTAPPPQNNVMTGTVYIARVQDLTTTCTNDGTITFSVTPLPDASNATVQVCEDSPAGSNTATGVDLTAYEADVIGTSTNVTVTWYDDITEAMNGTVNTIPGATVNVAGSRQVFARIVDNNPPGCFAVAELNLLVKPLPTNAAIFGKSAVCVGDPLTPPDELPVEIYQVTPVSGAQYIWDIPDDAATEFKVFGGGTSNDFFVLLQFPNVFTGDIRVRVELNGCGGVELVKNIAVSPSPTAPPLTGPDVVCTNEIGVAFESGAGSTYDWEITPPGAALIVSGQTTNRILVNFLDQDAIVSVRESNASSCISPPTTLNVQVNERPQMLDPSKEVCSDEASGIIFTDAGSSPVPSNRWEITNVTITPGVVQRPGTPTSGVVTNNNALANDTYENLKAVPLPVRYTVTPYNVDGVTGHQCPGNTQIVTLSVKPEPQLDPNLDKAICSDAETEITLVSAPNTFPADKFIIESITGAGLTLMNPPAPATGTQLNSDAIFANRWENTTSTAQQLTYTVRPFSTVLGCAGDPPTDVLVTVNPKPLVQPPALAPFCSGDNISIPLTTSNAVAGATFVWTVKSISGNITGAQSGTGAGTPGIVGVLTNNDLVQGSVTYEVRAMNSAPLGGCLGPPIDVQVFVNPSPPATPVTTSVCSDTPGGNTFTEDLISIQPQVSTAPGVTFTWFTNQSNEAGSIIPAGSLGSFTLTNNISIFVRVDNGICSKVVSVTYTINPNISLTLSATDYNGVQLKCNNDNTGQITALAALGTPVYSFSLDGGPFITSNQFSFLPAGLHTLVARDARGCSTSEDITLVEPPVLTGDIIELEPITCFLDNDAVIQTNPAGGTGAYSFVLLQNPTNTSGVANGIFTDISIGTYNVRITDVNDCTVDTPPLTITQPTQVEGTATIAEDANGFQLSCADATDAQITMTATGGNGPDYTYTLVRTNDPANDPNPYAQITGTATETFTNLPFGNYTISVQDNKNCPSLPIIAVIVNPPPFEPGFVGVNQSVCSGNDPAQIEELVPPFGGVGNYTYQWQQSLTGSTNDADWSNIPGENQAEYDPPVLPQTTYFRRLVSSGSCEVKGRDNIVRVTINPLPAALLSGPVEVCQGESFLLNMTLTTGTAPMEYDYTATTVNGTTSFNNLIGVDNTFIPITNFQEPTTYQITRVRDLNGCVAPPANLPAPVTVDIIKISSDFTILAPDAQCPGGEFNFQWEVESNVDYTWVWSDNTSTVIPANSLPVGTNQIQHTFGPTSTQTSTIFPVALTATNSLCLPKTTSKPVTVFPNVVLNILPGDTIICSGESVQFRNQSLGNDFDRWYYRPQGTTDVLDERTSKDVTFVMNNNSDNNPIHYEVIYEARNNEGCTASYMTTVRVYRGMTASFATSPPPPILFAGQNTITVTNTSIPTNDLGHFEYQWDFGDNQADPPTATGTGPFDVIYDSPGFKDIVLTMVNIQARDDGEVCRSLAVNQINIELPNVSAAFQVTPRESCAPTELVIDNLSLGADTFNWILTNEFGQEVGTSNLFEPTFQVNKEGEYTVSLVARYLNTNQQALAEITGIKVYAKPAAIFDVRPTVVFVPDQDLFTFNNSVRANTYFWDFGDGATSDLFQPTHLYGVEGSYTITLTAAFDHGMVDVDGDGVADMQLVCSDTAATTIIARDGGLTKIPNAFTPNKSGPSSDPSQGTFNDVFLPITRGVEEFTMQIFDRWGNLVFESQRKDLGWNGYDRNGRLMPAGVYVYKLVLRLSNGERTTKVGDVTLIR